MKSDLQNLHLPHSVLAEFAVARELPLRDRLVELFKKVEVVGDTVASLPQWRLAGLDLDHQSDSPAGNRSRLEFVNLQADCILDVTIVDWKVESLNLAGI